MKYLMGIFILFFVSSCFNDNSNNNANLKEILNLDSTFAITLNDSVNTAKSLINFVINVKCNDENGYTGSFELNYNIDDKSFESCITESNCRIPFQGYQCPNSLLDFFFDDLKIELTQKLNYYVLNKEISLDSIQNLVIEHIGHSIAYDNDYRISLVVPPNMKIEKTSIILWEIISGYDKLLQKKSLFLSKKEFSKLTKKELVELKGILPLNIRIITSK